MNVARIIPVLLAFAGLSLPRDARCDDANTPSEYGLAVGKKMPFHVTDFVNGTYKGHCGCPSVMISNAKGRGVIVWSRNANEAAFRLAGALDAGAAEGDKFQRFLVLFNPERQDVGDRAGKLNRVLVGEARESAKAAFDSGGVPAKVSVLVFFLDRKDIMSMWSFTADDLQEKKVEEVAAAAKKFAAGEK